MTSCQIILPDGGKFGNHGVLRTTVVVVFEQYVRLAIVPVTYDRERFLGRHGQLQITVRLAHHGQESLEFALPVLFLVHERPGAAHAQRLEPVVLHQPTVLVPLNFAQVTDQLTERDRVLLFGRKRHTVKPAQRSDGHGQVFVVHVRAMMGRVFRVPGLRVTVGPRVLEHDRVTGPMGAALVATVHEHGQRGRAGPIRQVFQQKRYDVPVRVYLVVELPVGSEDRPQLFHGRFQFRGQPDVRFSATAASHAKPPRGHRTRQTVRLVQQARVPRIAVRIEGHRPVGRRAVRPVLCQHVGQPTRERFAIHIALINLSDYRPFGAPLFARVRRYETAATDRRLLRIEIPLCRKYFDSKRRFRSSDNHTRLSFCSVHVFGARHQATRLLLSPIVHCLIYAATALCALGSRFVRYARYMYFRDVPPRMCRIIDRHIK